MTYAINDKVRLAAARGAWVGFITGRASGPGAAPSWIVHSIRDSLDEGSCVAIEQDIDTVLDAPVYTVAQQVSLGFRTGTIITDHADGTFTVRVTRDINRNIRAVTDHRVPLWLIGINNS